MSTRDAAFRQTQFLDVVDRDEASRRFTAALTLDPIGEEEVSLEDALGRVLARTVAAAVDVPAFDRSNVDGFAVRSADTHGAEETSPVELGLVEEVLTPGVEPTRAVSAGHATPIATGGMMPRGADAVVMIEHTDLLERDGRRTLLVRGAVAPGRFVSFAGSDVARGETVLRPGQPIGSREIGMLAAIGLAEVTVYRRPRVAILSTGDELIAPGQPMRPGGVYDSNAAILGAAVRELGCEPVSLGIVEDDEHRLRAALTRALDCDAVLLSGGTSKGPGDISYRCVGELDDPGVVVHGVALKPGKPLCLAVTAGKPVVILPGFPTSAIFTFHEFVAPVLTRLAGRPCETRLVVDASLPLRVSSERGRTEFLMVSLLETAAGLAAYPMAKGSGSVSTFSFADGFITIDQLTERVEAGSPVRVHLIGARPEPNDLVFVGSHCVGFDLLMTELRRRGVSVKALYVGSMGGLAAARRGECDLAGIHLLDPRTGVYNQPLLTPELALVPGYERMQGIVFRPGDPRFEGRSLEEALPMALDDSDCVMVSRNAGSGTRVLIDRLLGSARPAGHASQPRSHNAVAAAVAQGRADWGVTLEILAAWYGLGFIPVQAERYDFVIPRARLARGPVKDFRSLLREPGVEAQIRALGFEPSSGAGQTD